MAQKKITDLTLRTDFDETCILPADDAAQTWRVTGAQILAFIKAATAPLTTRGDVLTAGASGVAQRLALGVAGKVVRSDGTDALFDFPEPTIASKTSNYNVAANDNLLLGDSSGGTFTFTLPSAVAGKAGQRYIFKKTDTSFTAITVTDGTFSTTLNTQNESIEVYCTGSAWALLRRDIESVWTSYTPVSSWVSNTTPSGYWKRVGDSIVFRLRVVLTGAPTSTQLTLAVPSGLTLNTAKIPTSANGSFGHVICNDNGVDQFDCRVGILSSTVLNFYSKRTESGSNPKHIDFPTLTQAEPVAAIGNGDTIEIEVSVPLPITGWNG